MSKKIKIGENSGNSSEPTTPITQKSIKSFVAKFEIDQRKCAKQTVIAVIMTKTGYYVGSNWCEVPQKQCPRGSMPSGQGYELCKNICKQSNHAEIDALLKAGDNAKDADLYLFGHTYCCEDCTKKLKEAGIKNIFIGKLPGTLFDPK